MKLKRTSAHLSAWGGWDGGGKLGAGGMEVDRDRRSATAGPPTPMASAISWYG